MDSLDKTSLQPKHRDYDGGDAEKHHDALNEVVYRRGLVSAKYHVERRKHCHQHDAVFIADVHAHLEESGDALVDSGGIGDQKDESYDGRDDSQGFAVETRTEEVWHGAALEPTRH